MIPHLSSASYLSLLLMGILSAGCTQKHIGYPDEICSVDVRFVWDKAREAMPEGMTLLFYPEDAQGEFWRYEISGRDGGMIEIAPGRYTLVAVNNDLPGVSLQDFPYSEASLSAVEARFSRSYVTETGMAYEGKVGNLTILHNKVTYPSEQGGMVSESPPIVYCYPDSISTVYNVRVEEVEGIERIRSAEATLEGCAKGIYLSTLAPVAPVVSTRFELDVGQAEFSGRTTGFPDNTPAARYTLTLRLWYKAGGGYEKSFDVTEQVVNSFYPRNVNIYIRGMVLPEKPTVDPDEVGMKVDVDGWHVIEINLDSEKL